MLSHNRPKTQRYRQPARWLVLAGYALASVGCYSGEALIHEASSKAVKSRLAEVDLGTFQTTLPRDAEANSLTELKLHIFGTVPRYRESEVKKQLKAEEYRVRAETLGAIRDASHEEFTEPNLTKLRERIERVMNEILAEAPVKSIGFYEVVLRQR